MRAVPSQAFVADHRISVWRFVAAVAAASLLFSLVFYPLGAELIGVGHGPDMEVSLLAREAGEIFAVLLAASAGVWWALWRLKLRGWAASILAGGALVCGLAYAAMAPRGLFIALPGTHGLPPPWITALWSIPQGLMLGWAIWRFAARPAA